MMDGKVACPLCFAGPDSVLSTRNSVLTFVDLIPWVGLLLFMWLAVPVGAGQTDKRLDAIFERIKATDNSAEGAELATRVWEIWLQSDNDTVNELMSRGIEAMSVQNYEVALASFDKMVEIDPEFAEGWNKRATVYYLMGQYQASLRDIKQTLALEPRHFGALSGMGLVFLAMGNDAAALKAFEAALKVNPHMAGPRINAEELRQRLRSESF